MSELCNQYFEGRLKQLPPKIKGRVQDEYGTPQTLISPSVTCIAPTASFFSRTELLCQNQRRWMSQGMKGATKADLDKATSQSIGAGLLAGAFGSVVGVGGGVLIVPMISSACRSDPVD